MGCPPVENGVRALYRIPIRPILNEYRKDHCGHRILQKIFSVIPSINQIETASKTAAASHSQETLGAIRCSDPIPSLANKKISRIIADIAMVIIPNRFRLIVCFKVKPAIL